jgi:uncharacterized protein (DUF488 family)
VQKSALYTIGHGSRKIDDFLSLLKGFDIEYLVDVRSQPFSRFHPQFNQKNLQRILPLHGIQYIFMGDSLGGRPKDTSCYDEYGKVDYRAIRTKDFFKRGIERLKVACEKGLKVAVMCSERNPCDCHRTRLIGEVVCNEGFLLKHIDEKGELKEHVTVISEINKGKAQSDLFSNYTN